MNKNSDNKLRTTVPHKPSGKNENGNDMAAIVLAAGLSQRMGEVNKLSLKFKGQTFLQKTVGALSAAGVGEVVVVLGHESKAMREQLLNLPESPEQTLDWILNPDYSQGQTTSVNCGLAALSGNKEGVLICLSDQPLLTDFHIQKLIGAFKDRYAGKEVIVPTYRTRRGNPVVISEVARKQVLAGNSGVSCRQFIDNNPELVSMLSVVDKAFITDIDTIEDYRQLNQTYDSSNDIQ